MYSLKVLLEQDDQDVSLGLENDAPLTEPQIKKIKKLISEKLNSLNDNNLDDKLGKLSLNNLKTLSRTPVLGKFFIDPAQTNSGQSKGTSAYDVSKYKSMQIVPFFVYGKDGENYNAENDRESYNLIFLVPAIGVEISDENMEKHKKYFGKQKGFKIQKKYDVLLPTQIADIRVTDEELGKVTTSFKTGNPASVPAINSKKASRRSSPQSESFDIGGNKENIVDNYNIIKTYNSNSHRKNNNMNGIFSGKLSSYLFEDNQKIILEVTTWKNLEDFKQGVLHAIYDSAIERYSTIPELVDKIENKINKYYVGDQLQDNEETKTKMVEIIENISMNDFDIQTFKNKSRYDGFVSDMNKDGEEGKKLEEVKELLIKEINSDAEDMREEGDSSEEASHLPEEVREFIVDAMLDDKDNNLYNLGKDKFLARVESLSAAPTNIKTINEADLKGIELVYDNQSLNLLEIAAFFMKEVNNTRYTVGCGDDSIVKDTIQKLTEMYISNNNFIEEFKNDIISAFGVSSNEYKAFKEKVEELSTESAASEAEAEEDRKDDISDSSAEEAEAQAEEDADYSALTGLFKSKIQDLYDNSFMTNLELDQIINSLDQIRYDKKLNKILSVSTGLKFNESSFVYKNLGLKLLFESDDNGNTQKILEKIDINVIFKEIQAELYTNETLTSMGIVESMKEKVINSGDLSTRTKEDYFKVVSKIFGITRARFEDAYSGDDYPPIDFKLDLSKTISYSICESILENKDEIAKKGFDIVGSLKKLDDIRLGTGKGILYSDRTYKRLAQEMKKSGGKLNDLPEDELDKVLDESVKKVILDIAIAQHMRYDEDLKEVVKPKLEKWRKSDEMSQISHKKIKAGLTRKKAGGVGLGLGLAAIIASPVALAGLAGAGTIAAAGAIGYGLGKDSGEESFTSRKDIWAKEPEVKQSAAKLFEVVTSLAADIKGIYLESKTSYIKGSLTELLFENLLQEAEAKELTYEDIRKTLKSNDILAFGFPDISDRKEAEVSLIESVGGMLEDTFDIKIKGIKNGSAALAMERLASSVDKDAEKGSPAVKEVSEMTAGAGVPPSMKDAMSPEQFMMMMNMSGGPIMMMFMQMMAQQQFQQQMMQMFEQMQKGKVSGLRAAETVEKASAGKLSAVEKALEEALKSYNATKPALNVEDARKIILTLKENKDIINKEIKDLIQKINKSAPDDNKIDELNLSKFTAKNILKKLKDHVKVVKDDKTDDKVFDLLNINIFNNDNDYSVPLTSTLMILIIKDSNIEETIKKIKSLGLFAKNANLVSGLISNLSKSIKIRVEESRARDNLFVGQLSERLFKSSDTGNKVSSNNKPIKDASYNPEYLKSEMKRIWKI